MVTLVCVDGMALIAIANPAAAATWNVVEIQAIHVVAPQPLVFTISNSKYDKDTAMLEYAWYPFVGTICQQDGRKTSHETLKPY